MEINNGGGSVETSLGLYPRTFSTIPRTATPHVPGKRGMIDSMVFKFTPNEWRWNL